MKGQKINDSKTVKVWLKEGRMEIPVRRGIYSAEK
jgi:hypothetical protein